MRSFQQRALLGFNKHSLIVCLSKTLKYLVFPSKWRVELTVWEVLFFPVPEKIVYSFFNVLFDILNSINLAYISQLANEDLVSDYIFTSQKESHSLPDTGFLLTLNYHSGHLPPHLFCRELGLSLQPNFQKGGAS